MSRAVQHLAVIVLLAIPHAVFTQNTERAYEIHQIEAAFIYNFIDFVTWPGSAAPDGDFTIGVLGADPFGDAFASVEGSDVGGKIFRVKKSDRLDDLMNCRILFISSSEAPRTSGILRRVQDLPVLTVSDMDRFTQLGGMIQFYVTDIGGQLKVRFDINKPRVDASGLKMSFKLLSLARPKP
jgi:hypothetical protein